MKFETGIGRTTGTGPLVRQNDGVIVAASPFKVHNPGGPAAQHTLIGHDGVNGYMRSDTGRLLLGASVGGAGFILGLDNQIGAVLPTADNSIALGEPTVSRFRNVYSYLGDFAGNIVANNLKFGTWTPNLVGSTSGGCAPTQQLGAYSRYPGGAMLSFMFSCSAHNMVGNILMTGLPFSTLPSFLGSLIFSDFGNWSGTTLGQVLIGVTSGTQAILYLYKTDTAGTVNIPATAFSTSGFTIRGSIIVPLAT